MTDFLPQPNADGLVKLSGTVRNLKVTRASASEGHASELEISHR